MIQIEVINKKESLGIFNFPQIPNEGDTFRQGDWTMYYRVKSILYHGEKDGSIKVMVKVD